MTMRATYPATALAGLLLLAGCGGERETDMAADTDMTLPADETVADEVEVPETMPTPGDFADPSTAELNERDVSVPLTASD